MSETWEDWPYGLDWSDDDKPIEVELEDGQVVRGILYCEDVMVDGDGEEFPFWNVKVEGRGNVTWAERWRFAA